MKKLLAGLFIFGALFMGIRQAHASVLSDALLQIQNLKNELILLRASFKASAGDVNLPSITNITTNPSWISLDLSFHVSSPVGVTEVGYCLKKVNDSLDCTRNIIRGFSSYSDVRLILASLDPTTNYTYYLYAKNSYGEAKSSDINFTTLAVPAEAYDFTPPPYSVPVVEIYSAAPPGLTSSTAAVGGHVTNLGTSGVSERGACYGNSSTSMTNCIPAYLVQGPNDMYATKFEGLSSNTTYYYRMYAKNTYETVYSTSSTFKTLTAPASTTCTAVLSASSTSIISGGSTTLSWSTSNCLNAYISNVGAVALSGTKVVSPLMTTDYDLTAQVTSSDFQKKSVRVTVTPVTQTCALTISANPTTIPLGGSTTLSWSTSNCSSVYISDVGDMPNLSGSKIVTPTMTTDYVATANARTSDFKKTSVKVTVTPAATTNVCAPGDIHNTITGELCPNSTTPSLPIVSILPVTSLTSTSATIGATVTLMGVPAATASSMCVSTSATITGANCSTIGISTNLSRNLTGLIPNTKYYYAGNAINTTGTGWSSTGTFTTLATSAPSITVLSPNGGESYVKSQPISITLSGGLSLTRVGLVYPDFNPNNQISDGNDVHWLSVSSDAGKSFVWDGSSFIDNNGNKNYWTAGTGNYKIVAIRDVNSSKCYQNKISDCAFDMSDNTFTITSSSTNNVCAPGDIYNTMTGELCPTVDSNDFCIPVAITTGLKVGVRTGDQVKSLQTILINEGYLPAGQVDGIYGSKTYKALLAFQTAHGLTADGIIGTQTISKLMSGGVSVCLSSNPSLPTTDGTSNTTSGGRTSNTTDTTGLRR